MTTYSINLNGITYNSQDFRDLGYLTVITTGSGQQMPMLWGMWDDGLRQIGSSVATAAGGLVGSSSTSVAIGAGAKTLTLETGLLFAEDMFVIAWSAASPANYMAGFVDDYNGVTGELDFTVLEGDFGGSGTVNDWRVCVGGRTGLQGLVGFDYDFDTTTTDSDPGAGKLRFNNADVTAATEIYVSQTDDGGVDISAILATLDDSTSSPKGFLLVRSQNDPTKWAYCSLSSATDSGAYYTLSVTYIDGSGATPFANGAAIMWHFTPKGDKGDQGIQGPQGDPGDMSNPMTAAGDLIVGGSDGDPERLAEGAEDTFLAVGPDGPEWRAIASESEAEAGAENTKPMTALRTAQAIAALASSGANVQEFTSSGTWTKPDEGTIAIIELLGAGGGGGSGARSAPGTATPGGTGAGGGARRLLILPLSALGATETVTIGAGGIGGPAQTNNSQAGIDGTAGGNTSFGSHATAFGGAEGRGGNPDSNRDGGTGGGVLQTGSSNSGGPDDGPAPSSGGADRGFGGGKSSASAGVVGASSDGGGAGAYTNSSGQASTPGGGCSANGGAGGGAGGGVDSSATVQQPSAGGSNAGLKGGGGAAGTSHASAPTAGTAGGERKGGGGGGSSSNGSSPAAAGGDGGRGAGGGGGGGARNGADSGPGGNGGPGFARIIVI